MFDTMFKSSFSSNSAQDYRQGTRVRLATISGSSGTVVSKDIMDPDYFYIKVEGSLALNRVYYKNMSCMY